MSRIYKGAYAVDMVDEIVIDSNDMLKEKLDKYEKERKAKLRQEMIEQRMEEDPEFDGESLDGMFDEPVEAFDSSLLEEAKAEAEAILQDANERANAILEDAMSQSDAMREQAIKEGEKKGYMQGQAMAEGELSQAREQMEVERMQLQEEYDKKLILVEREITSTICDIAEKVFLTEFSSKKEILYHLVENAISNIDPSGDFIVKVNQSGYDFLLVKREELLSSLGEGVSIEFAVDPILADGDCIIETDGGMFDCSFGTELKELLKEIKILSSK